MNSNKSRVGDAMDRYRVALAESQRARKVLADELRRAYGQHHDEVEDDLIEEEIRHLESQPSVGVAQARLFAELRRTIG